MGKTCTPKKSPVALDIKGTTPNKRNLVMKNLLMIFVVVFVAWASDALALKFFLGKATGTFPGQVRVIAQPHTKTCESFSFNQRLLYCEVGTQSCNTANGQADGAFDVDVAESKLLLNQGEDDLCNGGKVFNMLLVP